MQRARKDLEAHGLGVAAITYDNQPTLEDFAERKDIEHPLLADPTSETIRRFGLLDPDNTQGNVPAFGAPNVAYPGYFVLDRKGVVRERFVDARYDDRRTAGSVVGALFPEWLARASRTIEAPHVALALSQSDRDVVPGNRILLTAELTLPPDFHVYAHEAKGYKPLELALEPSPLFTLAPVQYPAARTLPIAALKEEIAVCEGRFQLREEVLLIAGPELMRRIESDPEHKTTVSVRGVLRYQACDKEQCFPPCEIPVTWDLAAHPLDFEQTDASLRKPRK